MPKYRITTRREIDVGTFIGDSTTVDSLDEARTTAWWILSRWPGDTYVRVARQTDAMALPEYGGTIGPLPDGTVIEVRPA